MAVRAVTGGRSTSSSTGRTARRRRGPVELAARRVLGELDTDHAAADLLHAVAERLARDVDDALEVRDRVAASRELREVLDALDTAVVPPRVPVASPAARGEVAADDDDPFQIGTRPPGVVDPPAV